MTYIVYTPNESEPTFLCVSTAFIREKDTLKQRTKNKWSLKLLESCERVKSNTLRINFDTLKIDKRERIYVVEDGHCLELEKNLRKILSNRDLSEMNQTIHRCVNCNCQFSQEHKINNRNKEIRCPDCKSPFVAEIHDLPKSLEKTDITEAIPAKEGEIKLISSENDANATASDIERIDYEEHSGHGSIGKGPSKLNATNKISRNVMHSLNQNSANSLNGSSSCSKISNPQDSFDSNQSVAGSSATDREIDMKSNYESDVDILSNPSQSSIEVLDSMQQPSRKASEERGTSSSPNLDTVDGLNIGYSNDNSTQNQKEQSDITNKKSLLSHVNLTESSSSGSVTDSVCTAYDQAEKTFSPELPTQSSPLKVHSPKIFSKNNEQASVINNNSNSENNNQLSKKDDASITSMFGVLFQSTNLLLSRSQKPSNSDVNHEQCEKYKFNFTNFNDVDHRLKLYFYQMKFEEECENFKWIVRGKIYNTNTSSLCEGIVVMSTTKCYIMEIYAPENDDVTKWLRQIVSVTVDRLESIQLLPWKIGLSFNIRDWGSFLLLLQDILRTDSLLLYFANDALPQQCSLNYEISDEIINRITSTISENKLQMFSLINSCEIKMDDAVQSYPLSSLFTTDSRIYLSSSNISWLSVKPLQNITDIPLSHTQLMSNLIEVEHPADNIFAINFLDETQDKCELWKCTFETKENAESCLNAIGQSWEKLFGVPLYSM